MEIKLTKLRNWHQRFQWDHSSFKADFNILNVAEIKSETDLLFNRFLLLADWFALFLVFQPDWLLLMRSESMSLFASSVWFVSGRFGVLINLCAHNWLWRGVLLPSEWQLRLIVMANINEQCAGCFNATALCPTGFPWYCVSSATWV